MTQSQTPVLFLIFNRPDTTKLVFERIQQAKPTKLFIAADGPRADRIGESELCAQARSVVERVDWDCEVHTLFRDENLGCKYGPSTAIDWFFQNVEEGIILEDDCVPDPSFFPYCQELLEKYRDNPKILSISGFNFGYSPTNASASYSFSRYMNMWGWATWRRSVTIVDYEISYWNQIDKVRFLHKHTRISMMDFDWKWIKNWRSLFDNLVEGKIDTWDYYWLFAGFKNEVLSIFPHVNLVQNIGYNKDATHTTNENAPEALVNSGSINLPLKHPKKQKRDQKFEEEFIKNVWRSYHRSSLGYQLQTYLWEEFLPKVNRL